jgi:hypothetical protein
MGLALPEIHVYPILTAIIFPMAFFTTYLVAVLVKKSEIKQNVKTKHIAVKTSLKIYSKFLF